MRIEVEVYKGPLSKEPDVQWGELMGLTKQTSVVLSYLDDTLLTLANSQGYLPSSDPVKPKSVKVRPDLDLNHTQEIERGVIWGSYASPTSEDEGHWCSSPNLMKQGGGAFSKLDDMSCLHAAQIHQDIQRFLVWVHAVQKAMKIADDALYGNGGIAQVCNDDASQKAACEQKIRDFQGKARKTIAAVSELAIAMKASSFFWAQSQVVVMTNSEAIASILQGYATGAAELSNQLQSKADVLEKQLSVNRRYQPLSAYLRASSSTDFINLAVWNRPFIGHLYDAFTNGSAESRVVGIQRLYADHNWSKINTAYASGQGDVAMAFIKDDIGNWNLKTFSNDPAELVDSYGQVGKAFLKTAVTLASGGGGAALSLLEKGDALGANAVAVASNRQALEAAEAGRRMAFGNDALENDPSVGNRGGLQSFRNNTVKQLATLKQRLTEIHKVAAETATGKASMGRIQFNEMPTDGQSIQIGNARMVFAKSLAENEITKVLITDGDKAATLNNLKVAVESLPSDYTSHQVSLSVSDQRIMMVEHKTLGASGNDFPLSASVFGSWGGKRHVELPLKEGKPDESQKASATFSLNKLPEDGDRVIVRGTVYTFKISPSVVNEIQIDTVAGKSNNDKMIATMKSFADALKKDHTLTSLVDVDAQNQHDSSVELIAHASGKGPEIIEVGVSDWVQISKMSGGVNSSSTQPDKDELVKIQQEISQVLNTYQIRVETLQSMLVPPRTEEVQ
ncbi:hypothetical protein WH96_01425 [Kiloniella spongiae]|uniref:Uncharacterized protein n=2 Tax=Kiloniella spongiae TaxID=1489064 RepID=A0A0H2MII2_9PROT|nr:hypothetical protein WH96_01425 [Kiloniella spongiae]